MQMDAEHLREAKCHQGDTPTEVHMPHVFYDCIKV